MDELEKAHPSVVNLFLQVFDEGRLTGARGRTVYFSDTTVIMTSNVGAERLTGRALGFATDSSRESSVEKALDSAAILTEARQHFPTELLSRVDEIVLFRPLSRAQRGVSPRPSWTRSSSAASLLSRSRWTTPPRCWTTWYTRASA